MFVNNKYWVIDVITFDNDKKNKSSIEKICENSFCIFSHTFAYNALKFITTLTIIKVRYIWKQVERDLRLFIELEVSLNYWINEQINED